MIATKLRLVLPMFASFTRKEQCLLLLCSVFTFALRIPLAFRSVAALTSFPYGDDAYYVFSIAKNLALGHGLSVDGQHLTNGFQPLIVFLYTPIFWLTAPNAWLAIRWTFVLNGLIAGLSVWAVARLIQSCERFGSPEVLPRVLDKRLSHPGQSASLISLSPPLVGAMLWTASSSIYVHTTNGLETGLYSLMLLIAMTVYVRLRVDEKAGKNVPLARWSVLGFVLGFTVLSRIDGAILAAVMVFAEYLRGRVRGGLLVGAVSFAVSAPWWVYNLIYFGSLMPTSGQSENSWFAPLSLNIYRLVQTLDDVALVLFYTPDKLSMFLRVASGAVLLLLLYLLLRRIKFLEYLKSREYPRILWPFAVFCFALVVYYTFFLEAPHFILRFLQPLRILWLVLVALCTPFVVRAYRELPSLRRVAARLSLGAFVIFSIGFGIDRYAYRFQDTSREEFYKMGMWSKEHPSEKIGMLQSGIASFVAPNVINLDGKVNAAALRAHQQGQFAEYLRDEHFTYIADWKPFIEDIAAIARKDSLFFDSVGMVDK
ncbi:MAG TPA: hypothetical protein VFD13_07145, partial [Candidatus Kapabacteria bacterium]|nr:hypothetical protein [Candidatus Kapabacteria bacterium]